MDLINIILSKVQYSTLVPVPAGGGEHSPTAALPSEPRAHEGADSASLDQCKETKYARERQVIKRRL
jgi:hypothetical protein